MKIFVSVVSYRDPQLAATVRSLFDNKSERHDIVVGIFEQTALEDSLITLAPELIEHPHIRYKRIDPIYADGVVWARAINAMQAKDEDFFYQVDSHMLFDKNWDRRLVNDYQAAAHYNTDKAIITSSCYVYELDQNGNPILHMHNPPLTSRVRYFHYDKKTNILGAHGDLIPESETVMPAIHICAGNFFTKLDWIKDVGYNTDIFFEGEEQMMVLKSFEAGYQLFHPRSISCYHYIDTHNYITKHWFKPISKPEDYANKIARSMIAFNKALKEIPTEVLQAYYEYSGVDYINQKLDERAKTYSIKVPDDVLERDKEEDNKIIYEDDKIIILKK